VLVTLVGGATEMHDNNGVGFPVQDSIMLQTPQSCLLPAQFLNEKQNLTVVAAVSALDIRPTKGHLPPSTLLTSL